MGKNSTRIHADEKAGAAAVATWIQSREPDDVGTLIDALWHLGKQAPQWCPELAERARAVMALDDEDPAIVAELAQLLEHAAERIGAAGRLLGQAKRRRSR